MLRALGIERNELHSSCVARGVVIALGVVAALVAVAVAILMSPLMPVGSPASLSSTEASTSIRSSSAWARWPSCVGRLLCA